MCSKIFIASVITAMLLFLSCGCKRTTAMPNINTYAIRLKPGDDLKKNIQAFVDEKKLKAAWISTCVGSLVNYDIRFANRQESNKGDGHFEILSLTGTLSVNGSHMHISISDSTGKTMGGHLQEGCIIYTTAEIVIQATDDLVFKRETDGSTPWKELQVEKSNNSQ
jgi:predicted DNA-binding protein with PD1-like motif